ncbi:MAG: hypothetical protein AB1938_17775 [Myxococcota bacterium]
MAVPVAAGLIGAGLRFAHTVRVDIAPGRSRACTEGASPSPSSPWTVIPSARQMPCTPLSPEVHERNEALAILS